MSLLARGLRRRQSSSSPTTWTFTVSNVYTGYTNPPTQAGLSDGVLNASGVQGWGAWGQVNNYIQADFGNPVFVSNVIVKPLIATAPGSWGYGYSNGLQCQYSLNGATYTPVRNVSLANDASVDTIPINAMCQYIRLVCGDSVYVAVGDFYFT